MPTPQLRHIQIVRRLRLCLVLLFLPCVMGGSAHCQELSGDTVYLDPIRTYYPGQPDTGSMTCELHWIHPPYPYSLEVKGIILGLQWTGAISCDSFRTAASMADTFFVLHNIYNDSAWSSLSLAINPNYFPIEPGGGDRHIGDYYYTVYDTGTVYIDTIHFAPWFTGPFFYWFGRFLPTSRYVSNPGDFNNDGIPSTLADVIWMIGYIFGRELAEPVPFADVNGDCLNNISDVVYLIEFIFAGGAPPLFGCQF